MRVQLMRICTLALGFGAPSALQAQRLAATVVQTNVLELRLGSFGTLVDFSVPGGVATAPAKSTVPAVGRADSVIANDSRGQTGAIIGGLFGAIGGGLAAAHFTHRDGSTNSTTGTLGGAVVGAGLIGTLGALVGLVIGSSIHE